jgi:hypothetical protein
MAGWWMPEVGPWRPRGLVFPPNSVHSWTRFVVWQLVMGMLLCVILGFGIALIVTSPDRLFTVWNFTDCYQPPPVELPCARIAYRGGALGAVFSGLCGAMLIGVAAWLLSELWSAVEPKPITDDFLRLLNESFGRSWRKPQTWPWARMVWAYGLTALGATVTAGVCVAIWTLVASSQFATAPAGQVETAQSFRLDQ